MASTVDPKPAEQYVDFEEYVDFQLKKARQQIRATDLLMAGTVAAVIVVAYLLAFVVADQWLFAGGLPSAWRWTGLLVWIAALCGWLVWKFGVPLLNSVTGLFAAQQVERAEPGLRSNLLNWVDLQTAGRPVDPTVLRAIERQAAVQLSKMDVNQAIDHRPLLRSGYALLSVMMLFCLYAIVSPKKLTPSLWRVLPIADVAVPTRTEIRSVTPGDADVLARSLMEVTVELGGDIPKQVRLVYTTSDQKFRDEPVLLQPDGEAGTRYHTVLAGESGQGLLRDLTYRIEAGDAVSQDFRVTVAQPPSARVEQIQITPPEYTRLPQETIAGGQFTGWEGSQVVLTATVNLPVRSARLQFLDEPNGKPTGEEIVVTVQDGTKLTSDWKLVLDSDGKHSPYYRIQCETAEGRSDPAPVVYQHTIRRDQPPELVLLAPQQDLTVPANAVIPLLAEARDPDFELGPVALQINKGGESLSRETLFPGKKQAVRIEYDLALKPFQLKPGDEITFHLEAQDNRLPTRNRKATPPVKIRIEAPTEDRKVQEQLAQEKARQRDQLAELDRQNADREQNPTGEQPPMGEPEAPREPRPPGEPPRDGTAEQPMPRDNTAGEEGTTPQPKGSEGNQKTPSGKDGTGGAESGDKGDQTKFSPDGQDDQELLQKLLQRFQQEGQKPGEQGSKTPQSAGKSPTEQPQTGDQSQSKPSENTGADGVPPKDGPPKPGDRNPSTKPQPGGQQPSNEPQPDGTPAKPNDPTSPDAKSNDQTGRNDARPQPQTGNDQSPKPGETRKPGDTATKPDDPTAAGTPDSKTSDKTNSTPSGKPGETPAGERPPTAPMPSGTSKTNDPNATPTDKPRETGDNTTNTGKPAGSEQTPSNQTPTGKSPDGKSEPKSPTGEPGTQSKPGQSGSEPTETQSPKTSSPMKGDPPPASATQSKSPDKQPSGQQSQDRDGSPDGGASSPKGSGRPNTQRSDQPQQGENGGSQQAQDGNSGSKQRGPGESTGRPGEQETGTNPSRDPQSTG
ncbi:MAG: hypothetical protein SH850_18285, partial [Planctomycetaceae bacterium]|nr:hypothetical protein [Planctomycetaceae bacterium]